MKFYLPLLMALLPCVSATMARRGKRGSTQDDDDDDNGASTRSSPIITLGPRPYWLVDSMMPSSLKSELEMCAATMTDLRVSDFSIGHRGACMQFPEHTIESYKAAQLMGVGINECDVTFTKDRQLVCRHAQCDLHTTTDVITRPELNAKCEIPFGESPEDGPRCCTSDFTLAEIKTLCAKMDSSNSGGETPEEFAFGGTADWRTDLYQTGCPTVPTHKESIEFIKSMGGKFTPELKSPSVDMPYEGDYTQEMYAQQMIDEYIDAGVPPEDVWPQSFNKEDVYYWVANTDYGDQAVALDGEYERTEAEVEAFVEELAANGVKIVAPPMWRLVEPGPCELRIQPSHYVRAAKAAELDIITWTLERTSPGLEGWYWQTLETVDLVDGDRFALLYVLAMEAGVLGVFSDWPATTTFFANCMGLMLR